MGYCWGAQPTKKEATSTSSKWPWQEVLSGEEPTTTLLDEKEAGKGTPGGSWGASPTHNGDQLSAEEARDKDGSRNSREEHEEEEEGTRLPPLERCEIGVVVDGVEGLRTPLNTAETEQNMVSRAVFPAYSPRCSEHPLQAAMEDAAGGRDAGDWDASEDAFHLEARDIERVCTADDFGPHRVHAELSCCTFGVADVSAYDETATPAGDAATPRASCEVFAKTAPVEYFHPANGADVYSSWEEEDTELGEERSRSRLLDPPPEVISVSLYSGSAPDTVRTTVAVPRWSSDGEVWEVGHISCSWLSSLGCARSSDELGQKRPQLQNLGVFWLSGTSLYSLRIWVCFGYLVLPTCSCRIWVGVLWLHSTPTSPHSHLLYNQQLSVCFLLLAISAHRVCFRCVGSYSFPMSGINADQSARTGLCFKAHTSHVSWHTRGVCVPPTRVIFIGKSMKIQPFTSCC